MRAPLSEPRPDADAQWRGFGARAVTACEDGAVRERWRRGRPRYAAWIARVADAGVHDAVARVRDVLGPYIRPVAPAQLHLTVFVCGFPSAAPRFDDDVSTGALDCQAEALRNAAPRAFDTRVGPVGSYPGCAFLRVDDARGLRAVRAVLAARHREIRFAPYDPHITVGAYRRAYPTGDIAQRLMPLRAHEAVPWRVERLELVTFDAATANAPLRTEVAVALGDAG